MRASACSKVLLTGAYLILDPLYSGLVLATDARFTTEATLYPNSDPSCDPLFHLLSPQFSVSLTGCSFNPDLGLLDKCLHFLVTLLKKTNHYDSLRGTLLKIELSGDNSFYSQRGSVDPFTLEGLKKLPPCGIPRDPSKKTGMGSSAGLVVSFVGATFGITGMARDKGEVHRYAQMLNAYVQDKVGSGFDIACSVYGS